MIITNLFTRRGAASMGVAAAVGIVSGAHAGEPTSYTDLLESGVTLPSNPGVKGQIIPLEGPGSVTFYDNAVDFLAALPAAKVSKGPEDFEESTVGAGGLASLAPPLCFGIANVDGGTGLGFPIGLEGLANLCLAPSAEDLVVLGDGFAGNVSTVVGANFFGDTTFLDFGQPPLPASAPKTAVSFDVFDPIGGAGATINVFDAGGALIGSASVTSVVPAQFVGIIATPGSAIASVEVIGDFGGGELIDNIEAWSGDDPAAIPTVSQWGLIVMTLLLITAGTIIIRRQTVRTFRVS